MISFIGLFPKAAHTIFSGFLTLILGVFAGAGSAIAGCSGSANVVCTGALTTGANFGFPTSTLTVENVTTDIMPAVGVRGISLVGGNNLSLIADLNNHEVTATGSNTFQAGLAAVGAWGGIVNIDLTNARITTNGIYTHGIVAGSTGQGATLNFDGAIVTNGEASRGIWANAQSGSATITANSDIRTFGDFADAIKVESANDINVQHTGYSETHGGNAEGFYLRSTSGAIDITTVGTIVTTGGHSGGIEARAQTDVTVDQRGFITTQGKKAKGVLAIADTGSVNVSTFGRIDTSGKFANGIDAIAEQDIDILVRGPLITRGDLASGVSAISAAGDIRIVSRLNEITSGEGSHGILADAADGSIAIEHRGVIRTYGANSDAIHAQAADWIDISSIGTLFTVRQGSDVIDATSTSDDVSISHRGGLFAYGADSAGIKARSDSANATVNFVGSARILNTQGLNGIDVFAQEQATVDVAGGIASNAVGANNISAVGDNIGASITSNARVVAFGADSNAIFAGSGNGGLLDVQITGGSLMGGSGTGAAIFLSGGRDGNMVTNDGALAAYSGLAVSGSDFADTITNRGTMRDRVSLGAGNDTIQNIGTFFASGDSDFGSGASDNFNNSGLLSVSGSARFLGLETFDNSAGGSIDMQDGRTDGSLELSGDFIGGGQLLVDAKFDAADLVTIGDTVTGETLVDVAYQAGGVISSDGLPIVDVSAGTTDPSNFRLKNGNIQDGLLEYGLLLRDDSVWTLVGSVTQQANTLLGYTSSGTYAWHATGSAWNDYIASFNLGGTHVGFGSNDLVTTRFQQETGAAGLGGDSSGSWMKLIGGSSGSTPLGGASPGQFSDLEFKGYQAGADICLMTGGEKGTPRLIAGVTFGSNYFTDEHVYAPSETAPNATNAGLYTAFSNGTVDASLLAKVDSVDLMFADTKVIPGALNFTSFGFRSRAGYALPGLEGPWSARIGIGADYTQSQIEKTAFGHIPVSFGPNQELTGLVGLTVNYASPADRPMSSRDSAKYNISLHANIEQDFHRRHELSIVDYALSDNRQRTIFDLGAKFDWQQGNLSVGGDFGFRKDLQSGSVDGDSVKGALNLKYKF